MTAITKSQLQAQLDEAMARIAELEAQAEAPAQPEETRLESNSLQQIVWLQKNTPSKEWSRGVTAGGKPFLRFGAQFSRLDKATGERRFGGWKNYSAFGEVAEAIEAAFCGADRLAHIAAFEQPSHGTGERANERYTEWVVTHFNLIPRVEAAIPAPDLEPSLEEIPF
jgi:L-arabinose isomerase